MAQFTLQGIKIAGIAASVPKNEVSNYDYEHISMKERELFVKTVGIEKRRIASPGQTTSDLCIVCAEKLITDLGWDKNDIKLLVFITQTPDYLIPATGSIIQDKLGLSRDCMALDINLGCSGYVYGISVISALMKSTGIAKALLLVGDVSSSCISVEDKSVAPLFSDAGSATAFELSDDSNSMYFNMQNDGSGYEAIIVPDGGMRNPFSAESMNMKEIEKGIKRKNVHLILQGLDIFNFSLREVVPNVRALLSYSEKEIVDFDYFIFHQANLLMNETIRKKLGIEKEKVPYSLRNYGNTSSATIPVTIVTQLREEIIGKRLSLLLSGFGVGLSWGSAVIETNNIVCPPLIEI